MFIEGRENILKVIKLLQRSHCCYDMLFRETPPPFCDCKYGFTGEKHIGEQTGCPELRCVVNLLENITDEEYKEISMRKLNAISIKELEGILGKQNENKE